MHARVSTFEGVDRAEYDKQIEMIRSQMEGGEAPPEGLEDVKGVIMLVSKEGKSLAVTLFDDEEALRRGDEALNKMNPQMGEGSRTAVDFYEVPLKISR